MKHLAGAGEEETRDPSWNYGSTHRGKQGATTDSGKEKGRLDMSAEVVGLKGDTVPSVISAFTVAAARSMKTIIRM
jgi:hypothetical protein